MMWWLDKLRFRYFLCVCASKIQLPSWVWRTDQGYGAAGRLHRWPLNDNMALLRWHYPNPTRSLDFNADRIYFSGKCALAESLPQID